MEDTYIYILIPANKGLMMLTTSLAILSSRGRM